MFHNSIAAADGWLTLVWALTGESAVAFDSLSSGISTNLSPAAPASQEALSILHIQIAELQTGLHPLAPCKGPVRSQPSVRLGFWR